MLGPLLPDAAAARRLAGVAAAAFAEAGRGWGAAEILAFAGTPGAVVIADGAASAGLALMRVAGGEAEILDLGVVPSMRRRGIGAALLASALATARGHGAARLILEVAEDNAPARALYARAGLAPVGRRRGYYRRAGAVRVDALILAHPLAEQGAAG